MKKLYSLLLILAFAIPANAINHPSLINTKSQWAALISSSTIHPWSDILANATTYLSGPQATNWPNFDGGFGSGSDGVRQQNENAFMDVIGAYTLLYVLNTNNSGSITYRNNILNFMDQWPALRADQPLTDGYNTAVPMNGAFFAMTLALDNIHDDLTSIKISSYEAMMDSWVDYSRTIPSSWQLSNDGAYSAYSLYRSTDSNQVMLDTQCYHADLLGNDTIYPPAICGSRQAYHDLSSEISESQLNVDGISGSGSSYAWERVGGKAHEKIGKWGGKYVVDFTGADRTIKTELVNFYEWLFTGHTTPFNTKVPFGDTANNQGLGDDFFQNLSTIYGHNVFLLANAAVSAGQYSSRAQKWANRMISISTIPVVYPGDFINYVEASSDTSAGQPIVSKVVTHGGAAFWDEDQSTGALQGVLDNYHITKGDHTHMADWNGLYMAGYGENLLSNLGVGANTDAGTLGFSLYWAKCDAHSGNTALFGNRTMANNNNTATPDNLAAQCNSYNSWNPQATGGSPYVGNPTGTPLHGADGITESILGNRFDYAVGLATSPYVYYDTTTGNVISIDGWANRNLVFVHPADGANGYFIVGDEMYQSSFSTVNTVWHPYGISFTTDTATTQYTWPISPRLSDNSTKLTIFLATTPNAVTVGTSPFNTAVPFLGTYINNTYNVDASSNARILTVLYPSNPTHSKATMTRVTPSGATGATIDSGNGVIDTILISSPSADVVYAPQTYNGKMSFLRTLNNVTKSYFVRQGTKFNDGGNPRIGFSSSGPVSIYMRDAVGIIVSPSTFVTFYNPQVRGVLIDGVPTSGSQGSDSYTVAVPVGTHTISFGEVNTVSNVFSGPILFNGTLSIK